MISLYEYMKKRFKAHIIGCIKRNSKPIYEGAKPTDNQYNLATKILNDYGIYDNFNENYNQNYLIDIVAYFIKYKNNEYDCNEYYIDIQNCTRCVKDSQNEKIYKVVFFETKDVLNLSKTLATSPWMGNDNDAYLQDIKCLIDKDVIEFLIVKEHDKKRNINKFKVRYQLNVAISQSLKDEMGNLEIKWQNDSAARNDYRLIDGKIEFGDVLDEIQRMSEESYITLKLAVFHARTVFDVPKYVQRIKRICQTHPYFIFQVIIVGKKSSKLARENSKQREFIKAYRRGIIDIYKDMEEYQDRIIIRSIRGDDDMARLRGVVLLSNNEIKYCAQYFWRYGNDRGIYRKSLISQSDNAFSRRFNTEFSKIFKESYPENRVIGKVIYMLRKIGAIAIFTGTISVFLTWLLDIVLEDYEWKNYIISILVALAMYIVPKIYRTFKRKFFIF